MRGLFVTATDTGVGKTEITAGLARLWQQQGRSFAICKPVATGAMLYQGKLRAYDTLRLAVAAGEIDLDAVTPLAFAEAAAPPLAARLAGQTLTLEELSSAVERRRETVDAVLVEGVGGLLCPLTECDTVADLIVRLELNVVVVAHRGLGTLNHTLLTLEVARGRGITVVGLIVNETLPMSSLAEWANVEELSRRIAVPILAVVPYREGGYPIEIPALASTDWWSLIG